MTDKGYAFEFDGHGNQVAYAPAWTDSDEQQAIFVACLLCGARPGRQCNKSVPSVPHVARIESLQRQVRS